VNSGRSFGVPAIFAIALGAAGSSIYFILGVVAGYSLGLTPIVFLAAAVFFVLSMMTYVEGNALHPERGGASTFARSTSCGASSPAGRSCSTTCW